MCQSIDIRAKYSKKSDQMEQLANQFNFLRSQTNKEDRPIFIYLPGMDGTGKMLYPQQEDLEQRFDIRALVISPQDLSNWDLLSEKLLRAIVAELKNNSNCCVYLCGESFGGCLALKLATRSPQLFDRVILVNPASSFNRHPFLSWGSNLINWMPELVYQESTNILLPFLTIPERVKTKELESLLQAMKTVPAQTAAWRLSLLRDFAIGERLLRRLTQPVLILAGARDRLLPSVEEGRRLVSILPRAQMVVLPQSGHACLLEKDINLYEILASENLLTRDLCEENC